MAGLFSAEYTHWRVARVSDGDHGWTEVPAQLGTLKGRAPATVSGTDIEQAGKLVGVVNDAIYLFPDASIEKDDVLKRNGIEYRVEWFGGPSKAVYLKLLCETTQVGN